MGLLSAILPINAALGAVSTVARALRPGPGADFSAALRESMGEQFTNRWDSDRNGTVSPDEFPGSPDLFTQWDRNRDGSIGAPEAHAALTRLVELRQARQAADENWALYDADRSGALTAAEAGLAPSEFDALDASGDGLLDPREWFAGHGPGESGLAR